jgi:hypothetical protein
MLWKKYIRPALIKCAMVSMEAVQFLIYAALNVPLPYII